MGRVEDQGPARGAARRLKLTPAARAWVAEQVGPGARVVRARRMVGGIASVVHAVTVQDRAGRRHVLVLRRYTDDNGWHEPRETRESYIVREAQILSALDATGLPVPRLVAADPAREEPSLLMTRLPGKVHLTPRDIDVWLRQKVQVLTHIHALDVEVPIGRGWIDERRLVVPLWTKRPGVWERAIDLIRERPPLDAARFIHGDFQHFNLLWSRERLTGVVDWTSSRRFYPDADVAHCRLNLTLLYSPDVSERFRAMYEAHAGRAVDPRVDVRALFNYGPDWKRFLPIQIGGRAPLDVDGMDDRVDELAERILRRVES